MARTSRSARPLTDHEEIRRWAEERGAHPACVRRTGGDGDVGMIRLDFPGYSGEQSLEEISWDEWFQKFDESKLALMVQDETARGERRNFNKLVGRPTAAGRQRGESRSRRAATSRAQGRATRSRTTARSSGARQSGASRSSRRTASTSSRAKRSSQKRSQRSRTRTTARAGRKSPARATGHRSTRGRGRKAA